MTYLKFGKKHTNTNWDSSSALQARDMDESSISADCKFVNGKQHDQPQLVGHDGKSDIKLSNHDIDELLECPICSCTMFPPILQCPSGHTICSSCKDKIDNKCPICRKEMGNIRCLALEKLAVSLHLPCAYHHLGCDKMFPYYRKLEHESHCFYQPYTCPHPVAACPFTGDIPSLVLHMRERHKVDLQLGCAFNHRYVKHDPCSVESVSWTPTLFSCFGHYFCLHFEAVLLGDEPVYMAFLRFMGEEAEARKFSYCLEVGSNGRKLTWQGVPRSIRTHHKIVRESHDGLIVHRRLALYFSGGDRKELKLRVTGRIWREM